MIKRLGYLFLVLMLIFVPTGIISCGYYSQEEVTYPDTNPNTPVENPDEPVIPEDNEDTDISSTPEGSDAIGLPDIAQKLVEYLEARHFLENTNFTVLEIDNGIVVQILEGLTDVTVGELRELKDEGEFEDAPLPEGYTWNIESQFEQVIITILILN